MLLAYPDFTILFIFITPRPSKDDFWKPLTGTGGMENVTVMLIFFLFLSSVKLLAQGSCVGILYNYTDNRPTITISSSSAICRHHRQVRFCGGCLCHPTGWAMSTRPRVCLYSGLLTLHMNLESSSIWPGVVRAKGHSFTPWTTCSHKLILLLPGVLTAVVNVMRCPTWELRNDHWRLMKQN